VGILGRLKSREDRSGFACGDMAWGNHAVNYAENANGNLAMGFDCACWDCAYWDHETGRTFLHTNIECEAPLRANRSALGSCDHHNWWTMACRHCARSDSRFPCIHYLTRADFVTMRQSNLCRMNIELISVVMVPTWGPWNMMIREGW